MKQELEELEVKEESWTFERIRSMLSNSALLNWIKLFSADGLKEDLKQIDNFKENVEVTEESIAIMDTANVKMFVTNAKFKGKPFASYSLEQIAETIRVFGTEGSIKVIKENFPAIIEDKEGNNLVILAPRVSE